MLLVLGLAFVVVPILELYVIIQVGSAIGALNTVFLLLVMSFLGAWLVRREGTNVWRRLQMTLASGQMPGNEVIDGVFILAGGALMLTPGFLSDIVGLILIVPPTRAALRTLVRRRFANRIGFESTTRIIDIR
jgi:UPF0716 protein FxsA